MRDITETTNMNVETTTWQAAGFFKKQVDVGDAMNALNEHVNHFRLRLQVYSKEDLLRRTAPGKWSKQEILGHLIDSALNNLKRFTDIQHAPHPYIIQSYRQDELVIANNYQNLPLDSLLDLWEALNRQIINVVRNIPADKLDYPVNPQYDNNEMRDLGWIICDYVAHLEHHLDQIFPS